MSTRTDEPTSGWLPDPTGRHEGRYFAAGHPTDLIRDGRIESIDPEGEQQLEHHVDVQPYPAPPPTPPTARSRRGWFVAGIVAIVLVLVAVAVAAGIQLSRKSTDNNYLATLRANGLAGQFPSDASAIAHAKQTCRALESGGPQQGLPIDKVGVDAYCPKFSQGFHVLETVTVRGSFTLIDNSPSIYYPSITSSESRCSGADGYSDIDMGTQVVVKNGKGDILTTTALGAGTGNSYQCVFPFSFEITEGQDRYMVSVGRRGEIGYTFTELKNNGVTLNLG